MLKDLLILPNAQEVSGNSYGKNIVDQQNCLFGPNLAHRPEFADHSCYIVLSAMTAILTQEDLSSAFQTFL